MFHDVQLGQAGHRNDPWESAHACDVRPRLRIEKYLISMSSVLAVIAHVVNAFPPEALARQQLDSACWAGGGHTADTGLERLKNALRSRVIGMVKDRLSASSFVARRCDQ